MKVYQMLKVRASSSAPLFSGEDGLTDKQAEQLEGLLSKIKLTELQAKTRDELDTSTTQRTSQSQFS